MRVAIVGSREFPAPQMVRGFCLGLDPGTIVVSGAARGVDKVAANCARSFGLEVIEIPFKEGLGKAGGPARNTEIVARCDVMVAFWDGESTGTADAITKARRAGKLLAVFVRKKK